jgi:hypothetical protein
MHRLGAAAIPVVEPLGGGVALVAKLAPYHGPDAAVLRNGYRLRAPLSPAGIFHIYANGPKLDRNTAKIEITRYPLGYRTEGRMIY